MVQPALISSEPLLKQIAVLTQIVHKPGQIGSVSALKYVGEVARPFGDVPQVDPQRVPVAVVVATVCVICIRVRLGHRFRLCPSYANPGKGPPTPLDIRSQLCEQWSPVT